MKRPVELIIAFLLALLVVLSPFFPVPKAIVASQTTQLVAQSNREVPNDIVDAVSEAVPLGKRAIRLMLEPILDSVTVTPEEEMASGDRFYQQIAEKLGTKLDRDRRDLDYIQQVGSTLTGNVKRPAIRYQFHLIEDASINAFAVTGGHIFMYRGMLDFLENEAQLAIVLGHEIGHVDAEHTIDYAKVVKAIDRLPVADETKVVARLAFKIVETSYSEVQEIEADTIGSNLAFAACYETLEGVKLWQRMGTGTRPSRDPITGVIDSFFRSHPPSAKRAKALEVHANRQRRQEPDKKTYVGTENYSTRQPIAGCQSSDIGNA